MNTILLVINNEGLNIIWNVNNKNKSLIIYYLLMSSNYLRYPRDIELSRQVALEHQLQVARAIEREKELQQNDYRRLKELEKIKAERDFIQYKQIRESRRRIAEEEIRNEQILRDQLQREHLFHLEAANRARQERQKQQDIQRRLIQEDALRKAAAVAESRNIQLDKKIRNKQEADRNNAIVLAEQAQQQRLEREICEIGIQVGRILDEREERKKAQLVELEQIDIRSFQLKQAMRSSLVKQKALEDSLSQLSKLIGI